MSVNRGHFYFVISNTRFLLFCLAKMIFFGQKRINNLFFVFFLTKNEMCTCDQINVTKAISRF